MDATPIPFFCRQPAWYDRLAFRISDSELYVACSAVCYFCLEGMASEDSAINAFYSFYDNPSFCHRLLGIRIFLQKITKKKRSFFYSPFYDAFIPALC